MANPPTGIQKLLEAETKAQAIVTEARQYRVTRLKASKADAVEEINKYKAQKEEEFAASTKDKETSDDKIEAAAEEQSKAEIKELEKAAAANKTKVIDFLTSTLVSTA